MKKFFIVCASIFVLSSVWGMDDIDASRTHLEKEGTTVTNNDVYYSDIVRKYLDGEKLPDGCNAENEARSKRNVKNDTITTPRGEVMVRFYNAMPGFERNRDKKWESGDCSYEAKVLNWLLTQGISVPRPIKLHGSDEGILEYNGERVMAYELFDGEPIGNKISKRPIHEATVEEAGAMGELARKFIEVTSKTPASLRIEVTGETPVSLRENPMLGDYRMQCVFERCFAEMAKVVPDCEDDNLLKQMQTDCLEDYIAALQSTPHGVVHADFYGDNVISNEQGYHLIDFGDAYFGALLNDIVIGAMEFSVPDGSGTGWRFDNLEAFLTPLSEWLTKNEINRNLFHKVLRMNCIKFFSCRLGLGYSTYKDYANEPYYIRYRDLIGNTDTVRQIDAVLKKIGIS